MWKRNSGDTFLCCTQRRSEPSWSLKPPSRLPTQCTYLDWSWSRPSLTEKSQLDPYQSVCPSEFYSSSAGTAEFPAEFPALLLPSTVQTICIQARAKWQPSTPVENAWMKADQLESTSITPCRCNSRVLKSTLTQHAAEISSGGDQQLWCYHELMSLFAQANSFQHSLSDFPQGLLIPNTPSLMEIYSSVLLSVLRCHNYFSSSVTQTGAVISPRNK